MPIEKPKHVPKKESAETPSIQRGLKQSAAGVSEAYKQFNRAWSPLKKATRTAEETYDTESSYEHLQVLLDALQAEIAYFSSFSDALPPEVLHHKERLQAKYSRFDAKHPRNMLIATYSTPLKRKQYKARQENASEEHAYYAARRIYAAKSYQLRNASTFEELKTRYNFLEQRKSYLLYTDDKKPPNWELDLSEVEQCMQECNTKFLQLKIEVHTPNHRMLSDVLLEAAQIPYNEGFTYSIKFRTALADATHNLEELHQLFLNKTDPTAKRIAAVNLASKTQVYADQLLALFIGENEGYDSIFYEKFDKARRARIDDAYGLRTANSTMKILSLYASGNNEEAKKSVRSFVESKIFGVNGATVGQSPRMQLLVDFVVENYSNVIQEDVLPQFQKKVEAFRAKGATGGFAARAQETGNFFADWAMTPFNDESRTRMATGITPIAYYGIKDTFKSVSPMLKNLLHTSYNMSLNDGELREFYSTIAGTVFVDILLAAATVGIGKAAQTLKVSKTAANLAVATNSSLRVATMMTYCAGDVLDTKKFDALLEKRMK